MAYPLNTSHPLYGSLIELFGVQAGALVSHKTARTFTKHADASYGSGAWGEHFTSVNGGYTAKGASFTPSITLNTSTYPNYTVVAVFNATGTSSGSGVSVLSRVSGGAQVRGPGKDSSGNLIGYRCTGSAVGTGQKMLTFCRVGETGAKLYNDTVQDFSSSALGADYNDPGALSDYLLGWDGQNAIGASLVWLAVFDKELSQAEVTSLYGSIAASNVFGLVSVSGNASPTFTGPSIGAQSGTVGIAFSLNVASKFSDTDALTFSAIGTWPAGITVSSAGLISGTPSAAGTYASLNVRATDTASQTVDSDTFSFTIAVGGTGNASGGTATSTGSGSGGTATGGAAGTGTFTSDAMENNTGAGLLATVSVVWTWYQGTIGAAPTTTTHGTTTTNVGGVISLTGLPLGAGFLLARTTDSTGVYYQPGTVV